MNKFFYLVLTSLLIAGSMTKAQEQPSKEYVKRYEDVMNRTQWWRDARFGMFIHFGAYAVPARGEWVKSNERMTTEQYQKYIDVFNPVDFDAKKWAKAAKAAGMKYAVLSAKHHDGFCLFDSKLTDYKLSARFAGRDLVREFLDAFRAEGLKVGLYYSLIDWHHPDYPNVGNHPQRDDKEYGKRTFNWDNYLKYMHGQVEELVKNYGKIDIIWLDYSFGDYASDKWKAKELLDMVHKYQPNIILNNRLEINQNMGDAERKVSMIGDFETPEQGIPDALLVDPYSNLLPWETCLTMNGAWGYAENDHNWKSPELITHCLVNCVSKNGNLLLNVGPDARGNFPEESIRILEEVGKWMDKNHESIYGCGASDLAKPEWGRYTQKGNIIFAHWMYPYLGQLNVKGVSEKLQNVYLLSSGAELRYQNRLWNNNEPGSLFISVNEPSSKTEKMDAVIKIQLK